MHGLSFAHMRLNKRQLLKVAVIVAVIFAIPLAWICCLDYSMRRYAKEIGMHLPLPKLCFMHEPHLHYLVYGEDREHVLSLCIRWNSKPVSFIEGGPEATQFPCEFYGAKTWRFNSEMNKW